MTGQQRLQPSSSMRNNAAAKQPREEKSDLDIKLEKYENWLRENSTDDADLKKSEQEMSENTKRYMFGLDGRDTSMSLYQISKENPLFRRPCSPNPTNSVKEDSSSMQYHPSDNCIENFDPFKTNDEWGL